MFTRMDHAALSVRNMARAIAFYRDVIGMEQVFDRTFEAPMARLLGVPEAKVRIVHMKLGEGVVELFKYQQPQGKDVPRYQQWDHALTHIGFMVEDFWPTYEGLVARGIAFLGEPVEIRPGVFVAYFYGVEGEVLEMREIT